MPAGQYIRTRASYKRNPGWTNGNGLKLRAESDKTAFEQEVERLNLTEKDILTSKHLKAWAAKHMNGRYVPESLLRAWGLEVEDLWTRVA